MGYSNRGRLLRFDDLFITSVYLYIQLDTRNELLCLRRLNMKFQFSDGLYFVK